MANMIILFLSFTVINLAALQGSQAVEYTVANNAATTPGGIRFTNEIGLEYSKQTLISATEFIWRLFQQNTVEDRRNTPKLSLSIEPNMDGVAVSSNDHIRVSANYINGFQGDVRREITGVLYHETVHSFQWNGAGQAPVGLVEGIADFVVLKAGYVPNYWAKPGEGTKWDEGYSVTAWFLDYCHGLRNGFVAELNKKMRNGYSDNFFFELLGKTVDQLWSDYKAKYNTN
ncbi:Basic secretory protease [Actinidia chinensis var. chinensis]|uniref:Basic secretory protease n=1 Tax=Actinidia chinensis var. chinensis TaxID=1590841 RepID=A0A2R6Q603_ACTCC|nr:Basic secretory protease [Actinidia chinensis var. chinensis]